MLKNYIKKNTWYNIYIIYKMKINFLNYIIKYKSIIVFDKNKMIYVLHPVKL